jgi:hypothetical protein
MLSALLFHLIACMQAKFAEVTESMGKCKKILAKLYQRNRPLLVKYCIKNSMESQKAVLQRCFNQCWYNVR